MSTQDAVRAAIERFVRNVTGCHVNADDVAEEVVDLVAARAPLRFARVVPLDEAIASGELASVDIAPAPEGPLLRWGSGSLDGYNAYEAQTVPGGYGGRVAFLERHLLTFTDARGQWRTVGLPYSAELTDDARRAWAERVLTAAIGARWGK